MNYSGAQFDYLHLRDNGADHQSNIYVYGGAGHVRLGARNDAGYLVGLEADAENRKYFGLIKIEAMRSPIAPDYNHVEARLGIAPYEAEYSEIASWFMVQAQWHPSLERTFVVICFCEYARLLCAADSSCEFRNGGGDGWPGEQCAGAYLDL